VIPDAEAVATAYLSGRPEIQALGARVVGETPRSTADPWVRITQLDPRSADGGITDHLIACLIQFDCYAGDLQDGAHAEASLLTRTVRQALVEMNRATHSGAVVTGADIGSCPRLPDENFEPARERYSLTATLYMHG
jgi:hypothetical protein